MTKDNKETPPEFRQAKKQADQTWAYTATSSMIDARLGSGGSRQEIVDFLLGVSSGLAKLLSNVEFESTPQESSFMQGLFMENLVLVKVREVKQLKADVMAEAATQPKH